MNRAYIFLLGFTAATVSLVGATFSISGLAKLFSGAPIAVMIMAGALEFAKLVAASFLHGNWKKLHPIMRVYLSFAVGVLMSITSLGIFGYLSYAYQHTSSELKNTLIKLDYMNGEDRKVQEELTRLQAEVDQIPASRVSKRIEIQKELEPRFDALKRQSIELQMKMRDENMKKLSFQIEIGPVVYVAQLFNKNMDDVATWLIILFVFVFDPLAVSLVLATSFAIKNEEKLFAPEAASLPVRPAA
ncbi:MAG: hypothetical protein ACXVA9_05865 [Bdellovibrionales bacterium]